MGISGNACLSYTSGIEALVEIVRRYKVWDATRKAHPELFKHNKDDDWHYTNYGTGEKMRDYFQLVLLTGLRRREASNLTWDRVNLDNRSFIIDDTKNRKPLELPIGNYVYKLLKRRHTSTSGDTVFDGLQNPLENVAQVSGLFLKRGLYLPALDRSRKWEFLDFH